jgi:hypothetical protein
MQTLLAEKLALTFIEDAHALLSGFGKILFRTLTAPVERIARACDVADVLAKRRSSAARSCGALGSPRGASRRSPLSFRFLNHLT